MSNQGITVALTYHEETKHSYDSVYRTHHFLDWDNQPQPFKLYTNLAPFALPQTLPETHLPALLTLSPTVVAQAPAALPSLADLAYVLFYAAGVTKRRTYPGYGEMLFRAAACTGALYHLELYLAVADLPELSAGLYHFGPVDFALRQLRRGDYRQVLAAASGHDPALQEAPVIVVGSDTFWRNAWKYRARAYRHSFWDAGTMLANLLAAATARGFSARLIAGFADAQVNALLALDTPREATLFLVGLGHGAPVPATFPAIDPLHLQVAPLSREEVAYPAIYLMHEASALPDPEDVAAWRGEAPPPSLPPATGTMFALQPQPPDQLPTAALEVAVRRRGSTRKFAHRPLLLSQLSNVLVRATQEIPADFLAPPGTRLNDLYLIINAVAELPTGAYVFHPQETALELLQEGDFRHTAGALALGQALAADASVDVFFLCDLPLILERFGNRGYRVAQLEAGILGGRMYLAAYAQGFGATGLTFFDDDVVEFFSPHAAGKSVMFLLALGYAALPQRR
jgi:SagB-type dehydrogenase family enzyme